MVSRAQRVNLDPLQRRVFQAMSEGNSNEYGYGHVIRVHNMAQNDDERAVAMCHDVVEDGFATYEHLHSWGLSQIQIGAVEILTRYEDQTYDAYVTRLLKWCDMPRNQDEGRLALNVKTYDIFDHLSPHRNDYGGHPLSHRAALRYTNTLQRIMYYRAEHKL